MAEKKIRFTFDDDPIVTPEEELDSTMKNNDINDDINDYDDIDNALNDEVDKKSFSEKKDASNLITANSDTMDDGDIPMKKKSKKKRKLKKWHIALLVFLTIIIVFVIYVFASTSEQGPVYGERCASLLAIDDTKFSSVEAQIAENEIVSSVNIEVDCRIVKISINYVDNAVTADAESVATNALHLLDDAMGVQRDEGASYSQLFGQANGRGQYNVEFNLTSNGDPDFPIFGTKHPASNDVSFTGATPADQETTDAVNTKAAEAAAEATEGE